MFGRAFLLSISGAAAVTLDASNSQFTALVDMLKGIKNDAVQDDTKEKAQWAKVSTWYTHFKLAQDKSIEELETLIETEEGIADSSGAQAAGLTEDINEKTQENSEYEQKKKEQTAELETKTAHCAKQSHDYQESIDALKNAEKVLRASDENVGMESLLQMADIPEQAKQSLAIFLQDDSADEAALTQMSSADLNADRSAATAAYAYEFGSGGLVEMVQKLGDKFQEELREFEKGCMDQKHAAEMQLNSYANYIKNNEDAIKSKTQALGQHKSDQGGAEAAVATHTATLGTQKDALQQTTDDHNRNKRTIESNQEARRSEMTQVDQALTIFGAAAVLLQQKQTGTALVQMKSERTVARSPVQEQILSILSAVDNKSGDLNLITQSVRAGGAFDQVKGLIKKLIDNLVTKGREDASHQDTCERNLKTNKALLDKSLETKTNEETKLMKAETAQQKAHSDIKRLTEEIADLSKSDAEAKANRIAEKTESEDVIQSLKSFGEMLREGIDTLEKFYVGNAQGAELLIQAENDVESAALLQETEPENFRAQRYGGNGEAGNVIELLKVIEVDEATALSARRAQEAADANAEEKRLHNFEVDIVRLKLDLKYSSELATSAKQDAAELKLALDNTNRLVETQEKTKQQLHKACDAKVYTHEERAEQHKKEIEALKQVLEILADEA